jgi:hypothetical protein
MNKHEVAPEPPCSTSEKDDVFLTADDLSCSRVDIGRRVAEAFDFKSDREIACTLRLRCKTIRRIINGEEFPLVEDLLCINRATGVSLMWLLTGEGTKYPVSNVVHHAAHAAGLHKRIRPGRIF